MKSSQEGKETQDLACADIERKKGQAGDEYDYERLFIRSAKRLCQISNFSCTAIMANRSTRGTSLTEGEMIV